MKIRHIIFYLTSFFALITHAGDFVSGGVVYSFGSRYGEVMIDENIIDGLNAYKGVYILPETVNFEGENFAVTSIADGAFANSKVTDVVIPNSVTEIGDEAFLGCDELVSITLPLYITEIPRECFLGTGLVSVALPDGVKRVGYAAFESCHYLHTVMLPSSLKHIDAYAFNECHNLYEVYCAASKPPKVSGWGIFSGVSNVDLVVADYEAIDAYSSDKTWGDENLFTLFPNEDVYLSQLPEGDTFMQDWERVPLGYYLAYKVINENDELIAITAGDYCYLPATDHDATYTIIPTTMIWDSDPFYITVEKTIGIKQHIDDAFPAEPEPVIVARNGTLYVYGDNYNKWVSVWDMNGRLYYQRISSDAQVIDLPRNRVYIVKVGNYVKKVFL